MSDDEDIVDRLLSPPMTSDTRALREDAAEEIQRLRAQLLASSQEIGRMLDLAERMQGHAEQAESEAARLREALRRIASGTERGFEDIVARAALGQETEFPKLPETDC
jgi:dsDNA-specific endonuclease/ATPase MutS2